MADNASNSFKTEKAKYKKIMADEEEVQMASMGDAKEDAGADDTHTKNLNEVDKAKAALIKALLSKVAITNEDLVEVSGFDEKLIESIRSSRYKEKDSGQPKSWDYVLAFNVGDPEKKHKPTKKDIKRREDDGKPETDEWKEGIPETTYNGQIMLDFKKRLENAKLEVKAYASADKLMMFLVVGITEKNLKYWADVRDADLLIDPKGAIEVGIEMKFPLALRTSKKELDESNWNHLYVEYHPNADERIYTKYNRVKGNENIPTVFDEKTRLRIIYECITTDQNDGGAEIAVTDLVPNKKHPLAACFPLHDQDKLNNFDRTWIKNCRCCSLLSCPLEDIRDYFGEPVGFYFGFLSFYMKWLLIPTFVGIIFFIMQLFGLGAQSNTGSNQGMKFDVAGLPIMGGIIIFWSVAFVDFWLRQEARLRMQWGMTNYDEKAVARPQFVGEWKPDKVTGLYSEQFDFTKKLCRLTSVFSGLLFFLGICVVGVIGVLLFKDKDPNNTLLKIALGVANGVMISVFNVIYKISSTLGNNFENHRTQQDYENALITKGFFFKFVNSFASLFYLGFVRPGILGVSYYIRNYNTVCVPADTFMFNYVNTYNAASVADRATFPFVPHGKDNPADVITSCIEDPAEDKTHSCRAKVFPDEVWNYAVTGYSYTSSGTPMTVAGVCEENITVAQQNEAVLNELFFQLVSLFLTAIIVQNTFEIGIPFLVSKCKGDARAKKALKEGRKLEPQSEAEKQAELAPYENTIEDMTELIVQFGYVTLFVMAFPLTPLLALLNNILEMKVDAVNLVKSCQRPHPNGSYGLGSWNNVLAFFSIISVATNVGMITFRTGVVSIFLRDNPAGQWIFFSVLSVVLGLIVSAEKAIIPDVPGQVIMVEERQRLVQNVLVRHAKPDPFDENPPDTEDDSETGVFGFAPEKESINVSTLENIPLDNLQWDNTEAA